MMRAMSQSQVHVGVASMGVEPIIVKPRFSISQAAEVHVGKVGSGSSITVVGDPA